MGGAHLNAVAPSTMSSAREREVVWARLDAQRNARRPGRANGRQRIGGRKVDDVDARSVCRREAHEHFNGGPLALVRPAFQPGRVAARIPATFVDRRHGITKQRRQLRMHQQRQPQCRDDRKRLAKIRLADVGKLVDTRWGQEALEARAHRRVPTARDPAHCPGTTPPQNPTSTWHLPRAAARFASSPSTVVVGGMLLSGISTIVVTPPAAAARVACSKPSHSARPGSLTCTCVSTSPGRTTCAPTSSSRIPTGRSLCAPTETMTPSRTTIVAGRTPSGKATRSLRIAEARSAASFQPPAHSCQLMTWTDASDRRLELSTETEDCD